MGECILARSASGGGFPLFECDAELTAPSNTSLKVTIDVTDWEPGLYRGMFFYKSNSNVYSFCPCFYVRSTGTFMYTDVGGDILNVTETYSSSAMDNASPSSAMKTSPSTNVHAITYDFGSVYASYGDMEVLYSKILKLK